MTDREAAEMHTQLEEWQLQRFGTSNQNFWAAMSEHMFTKFMTERTEDHHECLGGNTEGYDVRNTVSGTTFEIKHTRTTANNYVFGGLKDKSADYAVFIKWEYDHPMRPEYCIKMDMSLVKENLNENCNRFYSKRMKDILANEELPFDDYTDEFREWVECR